MNCIYCGQKLQSCEGDDVFAFYECGPCHTGFLYNLIYKRITWTRLYYGDYNIKIYPHWPSSFIRFFHNNTEILKISKMYWIFPSTMPYWVNRFKTLVPFS